MADGSNGNGRNGFMHWLRKYSAIVVAVVATGGACTALKVCVNDVAPIAGLQTAAAAKATAEANAKDHDTIIQSIATIERKHEEHRKAVIEQTRQTDEAVLEMLDAVSPKRAKKIRTKRDKGRGGVNP